MFSTRRGTRISGYSKAKAKIDEISGVREWRLHDSRRTMRPGLAALRVDPNIAERVIGHAITGVRGVYDRHLYLSEKRDALERWARRLYAIVNPPPENVIPFGGVVERAIRPLNLNRKNALFAGSDNGAEHWAVIASLIKTCKLLEVEPQGYLAGVITRIVNGHPQTRLDDLMPWAYPATPQIPDVA